MAMYNISKEEFDTVKRLQAGAQTSISRSRKVMRSLRGLVEDRLEKSLVLAGNEALERCYSDIASLGAKLKQLKEAKEEPGHD